MTWHRPAAALVLSMVMASRAAFAQTQVPAPRDSQLAMAHYEAGSAAFRAGRFLEAATEFRFAYEAIHDPALLFNVGSALYDGGDLAGAREAFVAYLQAAPAAPNRLFVEARIAAIRAREASGVPLATVASAAPSPVVAPAPLPIAAPVVAPVVAPASVPRDAFPFGPVIVVGVGVLAFGASGVLYAMRAGALQPCVENPDAWVCPTEGSASDARTDTTLTTVTLALGTAAVVGGGVWLLIDRLGTRHATTRPTVTAWTQHGAGGLTIGGAF